MNAQILKILHETQIYLEHCNRMAPFPVFDTGYIEDIKTRIENMEQSKMDFDEMPVAACKHCDNLWIENDEVENDVCMRCGAINELIIYPTIHDYLKAIKDEG